MRHKKLYDMYGTGVKLMCGKKLVAAGPQSANWRLDCTCGMYVATSGSSPDSDRVYEHEYK